jgi:hypothetical protein
VDEPRSITISLAELRHPMPALTESGGGVMAEAASVCLAHCGHGISVKMEVYRGADSPSAITCTIDRLVVTETLMRAYDDLQDATEDGAYGVAIMLLKRLEGYSVVKRARKRTGFDYWLGNEGDLSFQNRARLEVSGILTGDLSTARARLAQKLKQTIPTDYTQLPAYVVVVGYWHPASWVVKK